MAEQKGTFLNSNFVLFECGVAGDKLTQSQELEFSVVLNYLP